ncbi:MAG: sensor histidine kinase [Deltaproteobacteria bacterium]|nr:sensor histidine kinase [Deltaproteobacteria bacterium]
MTRDLERDLFRDISARARRALLASAPLAIIYDALYTILDVWKQVSSDLDWLRHGLSLVMICFAAISYRPKRPEIPYFLAIALAFITLAYVLLVLAATGGAASEELPFFFVVLGVMPQLLPLPGVARAAFFTGCFVAFVTFVLLFPAGTNTSTLIRIAAIATLVAAAASWVQFRTYVEAVRTRRDLRDETERSALDRERKRLARDLHDHIGARLAGIALRSERDLQRVPEAATALAWLQESISGCIGELRDTVWALSDAKRDPQEILARLRRYAEDICTSAGVGIEFTIDPVTRPLSPATSAALLAITREAITNSVQHGRAEHTNVSLRCTGDTLELVIEDDGVWRDEARESDGHGLENMRARARSAGGEMSFERRERGARVRVVLSLAPA